MTDANTNALPRDCFQDMGELSCGDLMMAMLKALRPLQPGKDVGRAALQRLYTLLEKRNGNPTYRPSPLTWQGLSEKEMR